MPHYTSEHRDNPPSSYDLGASGIVFVVEARPPSQNEMNAKEHYGRARVRNAWKTAVQAAARGIRPVERYPVQIGVWAEFGPGERRLDVDGLAAAAKAGVDQLRAMGVLKNDSPDYVSQVSLGPCVRTEGKSRTIYTITRAD